MAGYIRGVHDLGGLSDYSPIDVQDKPLEYWEQCIHALLVVLSKKTPALLTTDELRRGVEALEEQSYLTWGYYDKWAAAIATILLQNNVISQLELDKELNGDDTGVLGPPKYNIGDVVQVKGEDTRVRWRKPHLRCPGYIFNCTGTIEKYIGEFDDPFLLAFRGKGPPQHLYIVSFSPRDVWPEGFDTSSNEIGPHDRITVEVYEGWLQIPQCSTSPTDTRVRFSSNRGENVVGTGDKSVVPHSHDHDHHDDHHDHHGDHHDHDHHDDHHDHDHGHSHGNDHYPNDSDHSHDHDHTHSHENQSHSHEDRVTVECRSVTNEGPERPGKIVGEALLRVIYKMGVSSPAIIHETVGMLEAAGVRLKGADLVVRAWTDPAFKARLLADASEAGRELDIATSNPNAPTVLQVMECTPEVHHVCVCTLCSCYPSSLLGLSPSWYKSRSYRSRTIREPRKVLAEFGTHIPPEVAIHVHDSTADCRYLVLPLRPAGTDGWSEERLRGLITRDSMIGVTVLRALS